MKLITANEITLGIAQHFEGLGSSEVSGDYSLGVDADLAGVLYYSELGFRIYSSNEDGSSNIIYATINNIEGLLVNVEKPEWWVEE